MIDQVGDDVENLCVDFLPEDHFRSELKVPSISSLQALQMSASCYCVDSRQRSSR